MSSSANSNRPRFARLAQHLSGPRAWLGIVLVGVGLGSSTLANSLALDDLLLREQFAARGLSGLYRFVDGDPAHTAASRALGELPWWAADSLKVDFWRPLAALAFGLDELAWPGLTWLRQLHGVVWYALAVGFAVVVFRQLQPAKAREGPWSSAAVAGLAALIWAVDDAHATSLGWVAARHGLIGAALGLGGLAAHLRWRERGWSPGAILGPLGFGLALLASESALAMLAYVIAHALVCDRAALGQRVGALAPYLVVALAWAGLYLATGHGAHACGHYLDIVADPLGSLARLPVHATMVLAAVFGPPAIVELAAFGTDEFYLRFALGAGLSLALVLALLWPLLRHARVPRTWAVGTLLAALVAGLSLPSDRQLMWVGLGMAGVVAELLAAVFERRPDQGRLARALAWIWLVIHLLAAPLLFGLRARGTMTIQRELDAAALAMRDVDQPIVLLNAPSELVAMYTPATARAQGHPLTMYLLHAGAGVVELERLPDALLVRGAWLDAPGERSHRGPAQPMRVGDRVALDGLEVSVEAVDDRGRPRAIRVEAEGGLDTWQWWAWVDGGPLVFELPPPGQSLTLDPATWRFAG